MLSTKYTENNKSIIIKFSFELSTLANQFKRSRQNCLKGIILYDVGSNISSFALYVEELP